MTTTLADALASGRGIERPFQCTEHDDSNASASVNIAKKVWYCYACNAKGVVDSNRVPTIDELLSMLEPEKACREYPTSWLDTFGSGGYWAERFPEWLCWWQGFGEDPWTGEGIYPVHTPGGRLAGVARRRLGEGPGPKYRYPWGWSASQVLFGSRGLHAPRERQQVVLLVEGAADAAAGWEVGCPSWALYGSAIHEPQTAVVARMRPRLILLGHDADDAGEKGAEITRKALVEYGEIVRVQWDPELSDPAAMEPGARLDSLLEAVACSAYGQSQATRDTWRAIKHTVQSAYTESRGT